MKIISIDGKPTVGIYEMMIDEADELDELEDFDYIKPGSKVYCLENSKTYMMDSSGVWTEVNFKHGGGSGGSGSMIIETETYSNPEDSYDKGFKTTTTCSDIMDALEGGATVWIHFPVYEGYSLEAYALIEAFRPGWETSGNSDTPFTIPQSIGINLSDDYMTVDEEGYVMIPLYVD